MELYSYNEHVKILANIFW